MERRANGPGLWLLVRKNPRLWLLAMAVAFIAAWAALIYAPLYLPRREMDMTGYRKIRVGMSEAEVEELLHGRATGTRPPDRFPPIPQWTRGAAKTKYWVFDDAVVEVNFDASDRATINYIFFSNTYRIPTLWQRLRRTFRF
jgi:hypothetical protein